MESRMKLGMGFLFLLAWFFVVAAIFMATWNHAVPRLAESVDSNYNKDVRQTDISYETAMVATVLFGIVFGTSSVVNIVYDLQAYKHEGYSSKRY